MKFIRTNLLLICILFSTVFSFAQSIQDFKGVWQGQYEMHWGANQDTIYNMQIEFSSISGNQLIGTASMYDNSTPKKLLSTNDHFEVTYNKSDNSFHYNGVTELPDGKKCNGETVYRFMGGSNSIILGSFIPSKKGCVQLDVALMRPDNDNNTLIPSNSLESASNHGITLLPSTSKNNNTENQGSNISSITISPNVKYIDADKFHNFNDGVAVVTKGGSIAVIDTNGNFIIPYNKYSSIEDAKGGMIVVTNDAGLTKDRERNTLTKILNTKGEIILGDKSLLVGASDYQDGCFLTGEKTTGTSKNFYFNSKKQKYSKRYDSAIGLGTYYGFLDRWAEGISLCLLSRFGQIKYGYFTRDGKIIIQPQYEVAEMFSNGLALVGKRDEFGVLKYGFIDKTGKLVIPLMYTNKPSNFNSGLALVTPAVINNDFYFGYINKSNELVLKYNKENASLTTVSYNPFPSGSAFQKGFALLHEATDIYIDSTGKTYTPEEVEKIHEPFKHSYFFVYPPDPVSGYSLAYSDGKPSSDMYINKNGIIVMKLKPRNVF